MSTPLTIVFVLSSPRSGSTWLNLVLGSCSWAMNLGEYHRPWTGEAPVICRLCQNRGLSECTLLHGYESVAREDAFRFASSRSGKDVLIDASKRISWCETFMHQPDADCRFIHLLRHPCGFLESQGRRFPDLSPSELMDQWEGQNASIARFVETAGRPWTRVCYDTLAERPDAEFTPLCDFIGGPWEPQALEYWKTPHHGLGGNGAASVYLRGHQKKHYVTGDDAFYAGIADRPTSADTRFRERLPMELRQEVLDRPGVRAWNAELGQVWSV